MCPNQQTPHCPNCSGPHATTDWAKCPQWEVERETKRVIAHYSSSYQKAKKFVADLYTQQQSEQYIIAQPQLELSRGREKLDIRTRSHYRTIHMQQRCYPPPLYCHALAQGPSNTRPSAIDLTTVSEGLFGIMDWRVYEDNWGSDHFPVITSSRLGQAVHRPLYYDYLKLHTKSADWRIFVSFVNEHIHELPKVTENTVLIAYEAFYNFLLSATRASMPRRCRASWWTAECEEVNRHRLTAIRSYKAQSTLEVFLILKRTQAYARRSLSHTTHSRQLWNAFSNLKNSRIKRRTPNLPEDLVKKWIAYIAPDFVPPISSFVLPSFRPRQAMMLYRMSYYDDSLQRHDFGYLNCIIGIIPRVWTEWLIVPVLKPGKSPSLESSYRPIALRSCLATNFEKLIKCKLSWWLERYKLIRPKKFGFRQGVSSIDALAMLTSRIHMALQNRQGKLTHALTQLENWLDTHSLNLSLYLGTPLRWSSKVKYLGMVLKQNGKWDAHILYTEEKCRSRISILKSLAHVKWGTGPVILRNFYVTKIRTMLHYGCQVIQYLSQKLVNKLECIQNVCLHAILGACPSTPIMVMYSEARLLPLALHCRILIYRYWLRTRHHRLTNLSRAVDTLALAVPLPLRENTFPNPHCSTRIV
ncbi:hypothetical protein PR048_030405 [Dryococelus australis]|uniref:Reverse transcriptase domain-containing protein n=1 Tax=Dryococelus australis TaxID=614101 RepID=A0ABQ9G8W3_9NEOP|nr:hypothetical protein PR048_030405 [Dryococelus australis]